MRYFRCNAGDSAYEQARIALDAAWSHPNAATKTVTCIDPAAVGPRDSAERLLLAVHVQFCEYPAAAQMLSLMLGSGAVDEITKTEYESSVVPSLPS
jgi:hypothetical protein